MANRADEGRRISAEEKETVKNNQAKNRRRKAKKAKNQSTWRLRTACVRCARTAAAPLSARAEHDAHLVAASGSACSSLLTPCHASPRRFASASSQPAAAVLYSLPLFATSRTHVIAHSVWRTPLFLPAHGVAVVIIGRASCATAARAQANIKSGISAAATSNGVGDSARTSFVRHNKSGGGGIARVCLAFRGCLRARTRGILCTPRILRVCASRGRAGACFA